MWQTINIIANLVIFLEVLYLFTCGQAYMKMQVKRQMRFFNTDRLIYLAIGCLSVVNVFLKGTPHRSVVLLCVAIALLFSRKCYSAYVVHRRGRRINKTPTTCNS